MNSGTARRRAPLRYVLVVFPSNENRAALLKGIADAGTIPLICHSLEEAEKVIRCETMNITPL